MMGSDGPPGPITDPPALTSLAPRWGSANTRVSINGTGFSATPGENHVFFDGRPATVVTATATQLVVTPDVAVDAATDVVVNVEVSNQFSNGLFFELVAPGTARGLDVQLPSAPTGVAAIGTDIYIAAGLGGTARTGGLFKLSNGVVTQLIEGKLVKVQVGPNVVDVMDVPLAITSSGGNLFYTTTFGAIRKYTVATGVVTDVISVPSPGNMPFPQRTGITADGAGTLYIVDRSAPGIISFTTAGQIGLLQDALLNDVYGVASDGTDLFVTNPTTSRVIKVAAPTTAPVYSIVATDAGGGDLKGVAVVGANVIASDELGGLLSTPKTATAGALADFGDPTGYIHEATGLAVVGTDLIMAQPANGAVRRKPAASPDATIVSTGVRFSLAQVELGGKWYDSNCSVALLGGPSLDQSDCAITEIDPAGTTRVLTTAAFPLGLVASGAAQLTVSDAFEQRIYTLDIANGAQTDLLDSTDLLTVLPLGLARDANALYYVGSGGSRTIGKLAGTTHTAGFVTGLGPDTTTVALAGGQFITTSLFDSSQVQKAPIATGGAATVLLPAVVFANGNLQTSAGGTLFANRANVGQLLTIDPATGVTSPVGSAVPPEEPARAALGAGFSLAADNTITIMDVIGGKLYSVAP
jgi:hypothetical protein